ETITSTGSNKSNSVTITVNPLPSATVIANSAICTGSSISIGASSVAGNTYSWASSPSGFSSTSSNPSVSPTVTTTYTLTETITATGCLKSDSVVITVNPLPNPVISGNASECENITDTYTTAVQSGISYSWSVTNGTII